MANVLLKEPLGAVSADATHFPDGYLIVSDDGDVCLECHTPGFQMGLSLSLNGNTSAITANTLNGLILSAPVSHAVHSSANATETVVRFTPMQATLSLPGADPTSWDVKELWINGLEKLASAKWTAGGYDFELLRARDENGQKVMNIGALRVLRGANPEDFSKVKSAMLAVLSLASRTRCECFFERTFLNGQLLEAKGVPDAPRREATHPLIPHVRLGGFMSTCAQRHLDATDDYGLDVLVSHYCRSHQETLAEAKMIFASVVMEAFKFYWALNLSGLPQDRKANGMIRGFLRPNGKLFDFGSLLKMASASLGLNHTYTFLDDRNALFHTGKTAGAQTSPGHPTWPILKAELVQLHDQIDDVLLSILGYSGPIRTFWQQDATLVFPQRTPV